MKVAIDRDVRWHAEKLEASETRRKDPEKELGEGSAEASEHPPAGKREAEGQEDEGRAPDQLGGSSSSSSSRPAAMASSSTQVPKVKSKFVDKKRGAQ